MPDPDTASWLATGWGGPKHYGAELAWLANSNGGLGNGYCSGTYGIRPALVISSLLLASEEGIDLSEVPTDKLLEEIRRRTEGVK